MTITRSGKIHSPPAKPSNGGSAHSDSDGHDHVDDRKGRGDDTESESGEGQSAGQDQHYAASSHNDDERATGADPGAAPLDMTAVEAAIQELTGVFAGLQQAVAASGQAGDRDEDEDGDGITAAPTSRMRTASRSGAATTRRGRGSARGTPTVRVATRSRRATRAAATPTAAGRRRGEDSATTTRSRRSARASEGSAHSTRRRQSARAGSPPSGDSSSSSSSNSDSDDHSHRGRRHHDESSSSSDDDGESSDDDGSSSSSGSNGSGEESGDHQSRRRQRGRRSQHGRHDRRSRSRSRQRRRGIKELELPTSTPSPKVSVSTWIDRVDLALKGARESGRGKWSDRSLYFMMGNKLMDNAAKWWVNMDRRLKKRKRTWTNLKKARLRRYGEKLDKSAAEWRVSMRRMWPGETYADFASGLRDVVGRNQVSERVLLAQFFRCLDKTTRKLVKQPPKPKTLEVAVDKATDIDDPMDNVAQGMMNIGQPWATAPSPYLIPMAGTMGQTMVIPGIGGSGLPSGIGTAGVSDVAAVEKEAETVALFTNPQGVFNKYSGTWDVPPGRLWNGKYLAESRKSELKRAKSSRRSDTKKAERKPKPKRDALVSRGDESEPPPPKRPKLKAAVKQITEGKNKQSRGDGEKNSGGQANNEGPARDGSCFKCGHVGHWAPACPNQSRCYACSQPGHYAKFCPNAEAKARNDAYLKTRPPPAGETKSENE